MGRKMAELAVALVVFAGLVVTATSAHAAAMTEGVFHIIGSSNSPASNTEFNVSVYPGNEGFAGVGNVGGSAVTVDETFNNPIADYRFFTDGGDDTTAATYANGAADIISDVTVLFSSGYFGSPNFGKVWETTDPGVGYSNPEDFNNDTMLGNTTLVEGSVDISELTAGSIYFFYGAYRSRPVFDLIMSDTDGPEADIFLTGVGDDDFANNNELYAASVDFLNDLGYDTISYVHPNSRITGNGGSGRFMGLVVAAPEPEPELGAVIPEPASLVLCLTGFVLIGLCRRKA